MTLPITLYGQRRPYNLPKEPIEFAKTPHRSNALDLQVGVQGRFFSLAFRYQRAPNPQFSFMVDASFYFHVIDPLNIIIAQAGSEQWDLNRDLRIGGGVGLAFWPWEKLRKGYIAIRSHLQFQSLIVILQQGGDTQNLSRFFLSNSLEIGARLGRRVLSTGAFGGIGFQIPIDEPTATSLTVLLEVFQVPTIYAYFGFSFGLTFR